MHRIHYTFLSILSISVLFFTACPKTNVDVGSIGDDSGSTSQSSQTGGSSLALGGAAGGGGSPLGEGGTGGSSLALGGAAGGGGSAVGTAPAAPSPAPTRVASARPATSASSSVPAWARSTPRRRIARAAFA